MADYKFKCPKCGHGTFVMVEEQITAYHYADETCGENIDFYDTDYEECSAVLVGYFCDHCDFEIPAANEGEVFEWLEGHGEMI